MGQEAAMKSEIAEPRTAMGAISVPPTLEDLLKQIEEKAKEGEQIINGSASGSLTPEQKALVNEYLDSIDDNITTILDPNKAPSLDPPNAGAIDMTVPINSLTVCADQTALLATAAHTESLSGSPSQSFIGTKIKTIKGRVLNPYRNFVANA